MHFIQILETIQSQNKDFKKVLEIPKNAEKYIFFEEIVKTLLSYFLESS